MLCRKKTYVDGAKRAIALNWKTIKNRTENNWLQTFKRLLSLEKKVQFNMCLRIVCVTSKKELLKWTVSLSNEKKQN